MSKELSQARELILEKDEEISELQSDDDNGGHPDQQSVASDENNLIIEEELCLTNIPNSEVCPTINVNL